MWWHAPRADDAEPIVYLRYDKENPSDKMGGVATGALSISFDGRAHCSQSGVFFVAAWQLLSAVAPSWRRLAIAILVFYYYTKRFTNCSSVSGLCVGHFLPRGRGLRLPGGLRLGADSLCPVTLWVGADCSMLART